MKLLFVTETSSIHAARWVNQFKNTGWDLNVFQGYARNINPNPEFECGRFYLPYPAQVPHGLPRNITLPVFSNPRLDTVCRRLISRQYQALLSRLLARSLAELIERIQPDIIHSLGLNINWTNMLLSLDQARTLLGKRFSMPWIYSSWGADLSIYIDQNPRHRIEVETIFPHVDYYISECERDQRLAQKLGFKGEQVGFFPAFGGITWDPGQSSQPGPVSNRKIILLKGRDNTPPRPGDKRYDPQGRAMTAMKAFALCQNELKGYRIVIAAANPSIVSEAVALGSRTELDIQLAPQLQYGNWLDLMGRSRLMIAITAYDGLPSTLVEALSLGAFPIHSDLESIREWIKNGENGLLVPPEGVAETVDAIRRALSDDTLVNQAAQLNARIVAERLSDATVRPRAIALYERVARQGKTI